MLSIKVKKGKEGIPLWKQKLAMDLISKQKLSRYNLSVKLMGLIDEEKWSKPLKVKIGSALLSILVDSAKLENGEPAFSHKLIFDPATRKKVGFVELAPVVYDSIVPKDGMMFTPRFLPMLIPPKNWSNKKGAGCYWFLKSSLMRTDSNLQNVALSQANIGDVLGSLDYLGKVPWRINTKVLDVVNEAWARHMMIGELPQLTDIPMPSKESLMDTPIPPHLRETQTDLAAFHETLYNKMCLKTKKKNSELHSLRCNTKLQLDIAEKFKGQKIFFPYNLDFRGRAYPLPPNLNHVQSDLCRGLLQFDEAKPLGKNGLKWLKVHLANLFGINKISHQKREQWVNDNMKSVRDSAAKPLDGDLWWASAEDPFQALATCFEIVAAEDSPVVEEYMCRMPVHQDGSCNGLQHYAALGKDTLGGMAVNLTPSNEPQDVYSKVLDIVLRKIKADSETEDPELQPNRTAARLLDGVVNRKVIKQTVMTSVYGVTFVGARKQILARLEEKMSAGAAAGVISTPEMDNNLHLCSM